MRRTYDRDSVEFGRTMAFTDGLCSDFDYFGPQASITAYGYSLHV